MSVRVKTQPVEPITVSGASSAPLPEVEADIFRGIFLPLVDDTDAMTSEHIGSSYSNGTQVFGIRRYKPDSGNRSCSRNATGGVYGEPCLQLTYRHFACTFDDATSTINAPGHTFVDDDIVSFTVYDHLTDAMPSGLNGATGIDGTIHYARDVVAGTSLRVANWPGGTVVTFSGSGSNPSGGAFGVMGEEGLPGFWAGILESNNPAEASFVYTGTEKFFGDTLRGPYNRFEWYEKNPSGYRSQFAAKPTTYTENLHLGTYHAATASSNTAAENFGYHFYYQTWVRHDLASGNWIRLKYSEGPTHQRNASLVPQPYNPVPQLSDEGRFWDTETRFYIDPIPYWASPQVFGSSLTTLYDRMRIYYEEPPHNISITWDNHQQSVVLGFDPDDSPILIPFTITNNESYGVTGDILQCYHYLQSPAILDNTQTPLSGSEITVPASGTWSGFVSISPSSVAMTYVFGVTFVPDDQVNEDGDPTTGMPNFSDSNVEKRQESNRGMLDSNPFSVCHLYKLCRKVSADFSADAFNRTGHGYSNGQTKTLKLMDPTTDSFPTAGASPVFAEETTYYIVGATTDSFQLSTSSGGAAISFTDNGTSASGYFGVI